jgi:hypothetical protein
MVIKKIKKNYRILSLSATRLEQTFFLLLSQDSAVERWKKLIAQYF